MVNKNSYEQTKNKVLALLDLRMEVERQHQVYLKLKENYIGKEVQLLEELKKVKDWGVE